MVLVQNKYKNTLVGVLRTQITFVTHSSPSCYVTLRTQVIRLNSGNLSPQKTDSGVFLLYHVDVASTIKHCKMHCSTITHISHDISHVISPDDVISDRQTGQIKR